MQICLYWKAIDTSWYYQWYYYHVISCNHIIVLYTVDRRKKSDNHQNDLTALLDCAFHFSECWEFSALLPWRSFLRLSLINTQVLNVASTACVEISFNNSDTSSYSLTTALLHCRSRVMALMGSMPPCFLYHSYTWLPLVPLLRSALTGW